MHPRPTILGPTLLLALGSASAAQAAPASLPAPSLERPYGNALGDGLRLSDHAPEPTQSVVCADGETLMGIDVSYYQCEIDWNSVAADGVTFAWVRVSHSLQFFDPQFEANLAGARAAGVHTGVYQYFEPSEDPVAQADLLLESMGPLLPGDVWTLLFTNDGVLARRVLHPEVALPKRYRVKVRGHLTEDDPGFASIRSGLTVGSTTYRPAPIRIHQFRTRATWIELQLTEGRHREIRRMCAANGWQIVKLRRESIGPIELGDLNPRVMRPLTEAEVRALDDAVAACVAAWAKPPPAPTSGSWR